MAVRLGASMRFVTALPVDPQHQDPLDPERILRELPERERENFLSQPESVSRVNRNVERSDQQRRDKIAGGWLSLRL